MEQTELQIEQDSPLLQRSQDPGPPDTEYDSKMVMIRAEHGDSIQIVDVRQRFRHDYPIPSRASVRKRTTPYFGPALVLEHESQTYRLTAPGPDTQLLLWAGNYINENERYGWHKLAEVTARFADDLPQYDLCPECGKPLKTIEHQRRAAVGQCQFTD